MMALDAFGGALLLLAATASWKNVPGLMMQQHVCVCICSNSSSID